MGVCMRPPPPPWTAFGAASSAKCWGAQQRSRISILLFHLPGFLHADSSTSTVVCLLTLSNSSTTAFLLAESGTSTASVEQESESDSEDETGSDSLTSASSVLDPTAVYPPSDAPEVRTSQPDLAPSLTGPLHATGHGPPCNWPMGPILNPEFG
eukprot:437563-Pelagomonas_calceolata.AAC.9